MGLARNGLETFASKSTTNLIRFLIGILTARFLGAEGKGIFFLLVALVMMSGAVGSLGLGPAHVYLIGKDRIRLRAIMGNLLAITGVVGVGISAAGWLFLQYGWPDTYARFPIWLWGIMAFLVPIHLLRGQLMQVLSALLRIKEINLLEAVTAVFYLLLIVLFVGVMKGGVGGALLAYAISDVLASGGFLSLVLRYGGWPAKPDVTLLGTSLRFGVKTYLAQLMRLLNLRLDSFLVAGLAAGGAQATGIYSVAVSLAELALFIPLSIQLSLLPMIATRSTAEANRLTPAACRHTMFLTTLCALTCATLGPLTIRYLYGDAFADAIIPLFILLPGVLMLSQVNIFYSDLNGRGKPEVSTVSALAALILTIVLDLVLIPRYGITGAAVASTCAYTAEFAVAGSFFVRYTGLTWRELLVFRKSDLRHYYWVATSTTLR